MPGTSDFSSSRREDETASRPEQRVVYLADLTSIAPSNLPSKKEMMEQFAHMYGVKQGILSSEGEEQKKNVLEDSSRDPHQVLEPDPRNEPDLRSLRFFGELKGQTKYQDQNPVNLPPAPSI